MVAPPVPLPPLPPPVPMFPPVPLPPPLPPWGGVPVELPHAAAAESENTKIPRTMTADAALLIQPVFSPGTCSSIAPDIP
jgi:hypothetical protein